jgi:hypothetical protein
MVGAAVKGYSEQKKAARAQRQGIEGQKSMQDLELRKARLDARRRARAARAASLVAGEAAGVSPGSSGVMGAMASTTSTASSNQNFLAGMGAWQGFVLDRQSDVVDAQTQGNKWSAIGSLVGTYFGANIKK